MDLTDLVKKCQTGDMEAFNELYCLYNKKALRTVYLVSGRREIADDIVQEAFIECFLSIKKLNKPEKFNSWFYSILLRKTWKLKAKYKRSLPLEEAVEGFDFNSYQETVEENYEAREVHNIIQRSIDKLSLPMKTVVILYYYDDMPVGEISSILGCFAGTVKSRLYHARRQIKKDLGRYNKDILSDEILDKKGCRNNG